MRRNAGILSVKQLLYALLGCIKLKKSFFSLFVALFICLHKGWIECVGIADRDDYDLTQHSVHSGTKLSYEKYVQNISFIQKHE